MPPVVPRAWHRHPPPPPLAPFVEHLWSLADAPPHTHERILPSGTLELVVNLHEDGFRIHDRRYPGAMVSGAYRAPFVVETRAHAAIVGVHFRPGGALPFLGAPPGALADAHVALADLWGPGPAAELRERLAAAPTTAARLALLERALLARMRPARRHPAVQAALAILDGRAAPIGALAAELGLSHRRFIELFTADVGMTPKRFARVRRFQRALRAVTPDGAARAAVAGYCDQSHMIREFLACAGLSPAEVARLRGARDVKENHLVLEGSRMSKPRRPRRAMLDAWTTPP